MHPLVLSLFLAPAAQPPARVAAPPGRNIHLVQETPSGRFWRGAAPGVDTLEALARAAKARGKSATLVDLRTPPSADDRSGKGGRLPPDAEAAQARRLGLRYLAVSALDRKLPERLQQVGRAGDVYIHCMYGVNRTGFAVARFARFTGRPVNRSGLGKRDFAEGDAFQARLPRHQ